MAVSAIPKGFHAVTPYLIIDGATKAIEFYKQAFNAELVMQMPMPDESHDQRRKTACLLQASRAPSSLAASSNSWFAPPQKKKSGLFKIGFLSKTFTFSKLALKHCQSFITATTCNILNF